MKFVVAGALGHIGSRLVRYLPEHFPGCEVTMVDNLTTQRVASLFDLPRTGRYRFIEADVTKMDLGPLLRGATAVVQLAAITDAAGSFDRAREVETNNFQATKRIAEACAEAGAALIAPSSTSVYGTQKDVVDEDCGPEDLKPQSPYAETKLKEEELLDTLSRAGLKVVRLRLGTIFGTSPGMRFHTAVNKFCWQAVFGVPLTVWRTAFDQRRPYLDLTDAVRAIGFFLEEQHYDGRIYNVVTANATVREVVDRIRAEVPTLDVRFVDERIMNQLSYEVRADRIQALGFRFTGDLCRGIADTVALLHQANAGTPVAAR
ncbi:MAG: SDR family oxidoreductase [Alphaproteobacteria bacterium]|nr:SDR family oxidoreductase [Alphaproteobacteria bacterium]